MQREQRATFVIHGLGCGGGGAHTIERSVAQVPGVTAVYVNPATDSAYVDYDPETCELTQVAAAVEQAGYRVAGQR